MAIMDMVEREAQSGRNEDVNAGRHQIPIKAEASSRITGAASASTGQPSPSIAASTKVPSSTTIAIDGGKKSDRLSGGPIPEKGSGQDRFRQMIAGAPTFPNKAKGSNASGPMPSRSAASTYSQQPAHNNAAPMSTSYYSSTDASMGAHGLPTYYPQLPSSIYPDPGHHIAVNPAMFPAYANQGPSMKMPTKAAEVGPYKNNDEKGDRNGHDYIDKRNKGHGGSGTDHKATYTSILSAECQKRRFNPHFTEWITADGHYKASVDLDGITMHDSRNFKSAQDAKQSLAKRAVDHVRKLAVPNFPNKAAERAKQEQKRMDDRNKTDRAKDDRVKEERFNNDHDRGHPAPPALGYGYDHYSGSGNHAHTEPVRDYYEREIGHRRRQEDQHLLERIRLLYGHISSPRGDILSHPLASQAFLEGFALGSKVNQSAAPSYQTYQGSGFPDGDRRRSRSPPGGYDRRSRYREGSPPSMVKREYRDRSPLRRRLPPDEHPEYSKYRLN